MDKNHKRNTIGKIKEEVFESELYRKFQKEKANASTLKNENQQIVVSEEDIISDTTTEELFSISHSKLAEYLPNENYEDSCKQQIVENSSNLMGNVFSDEYASRNTSGRVGWHNQENLMNLNQVIVDMDSISSEDSYNFIPYDQYPNPRSCYVSSGLRISYSKEASSEESNRINYPVDDGFFKNGFIISIKRKKVPKCLLHMKLLKKNVIKKRNEIHINKREDEKEKTIVNEVLVDNKDTYTESMCLSRDTDNDILSLDNKLETIRITDRDESSSCPFNKKETAELDQRNISLTTDTDLFISKVEAKEYIELSEDTSLKIVPVNKNNLSSVNELSKLHLSDIQDNVNNLPNESINNIFIDENLNDSILTSINSSSNQLLNNTMYNSEPFLNTTPSSKLIPHIPDNINVPLSPTDFTYPDLTWEFNFSENSKPYMKPLPKNSIEFGKNDVVIPRGDFNWSDIDHTCFVPVIEFLRNRGNESPVSSVLTDFEMENISENIGENEMDLVNSQNLPEMISIPNLRSNRKEQKSNHMEAKNDPNFLFFIKKSYNLSKKDASAYLREQNRLLLERATKNEAEIIECRKKYFLHSSPTSVTIFSVLDQKSYQNKQTPKSKIASKIPTDGNTPYTDIKGLSLNKDEVTIKLERANDINDIELPNYKKLEFDYYVYKHDEDLSSIASSMRMDIKEVILVYYLKYHKREVEMTDELLNFYVTDQWSLRDRILFDDNFSKHGTRFSRYLMKKSDNDMHLYYKFYISTYLPVNWSDEERYQFSKTLSSFRKNWTKMAENFPNKTPQDLQVYYETYYKKLNEEMKTKEIELGEDTNTKRIKRANNKK